MKTRRNMVKRWIAGVLAVTMLSSTMSTAAFAAPESTDAPETVETTRVTAWNWTDGSALTWQEDTSAWTLTLSEEQTISAEADLLALLPVSVEATLAQAGTESTPAPDTAATPVPESTPDTEATEVTPTPVAEVDPAAEEGATAPAAAALAQPEEGATGADTLSVEPQNIEEATPAPETATPDPTTAPQPTESPAPTADAEPTEEPAAEADTETLTLTWDTAALTYPLAGGDYTVTAALPEGYALDEAAPALTVTVQVPGAEEEDTPAADNSLSDSASAPSMMAENPLETIDTVSPVGTTINLFDYWFSNKNEKTDSFQNFRRLTDINYAATNWQTGINYNHALKFSPDTGDKIPDTLIPNPTAEGGANQFVGEGNGPFTKIVQNTLVDGYPKLNKDIMQDCMNWSYRHSLYNITEELNYNESLNYLFDPSYGDENGCAAYTDVKGLFYLDENGYYAYNCAEHFAQFTEDGSGSGSFTLFEDPWGFGFDGDNGGQFFPFNTPADKKENVNHFFGLTMTTHFMQTDDGKDANDNAVTYHFAGDDDVWVFIDGVLVGDLGGIHQKASLDINFADGSITVRNAVNGKVTESSDLKRKFIDALGEGNINQAEFSGDTFANGTYHTLQFFYLERGANQSNLELKFNLVSAPESTIESVDQNGNGVNATSFTLYGADNNYTQQDLIASGVTAVDGKLVLQDNDGKTIGLQDLWASLEQKGLVDQDTQRANLILKQDLPDGYRGASTLYLYLIKRGENVLLLSDRTWETGAYAYSNSTITLSSPELSAWEGDSSKTANLSNPDQRGTLFAVVLRRDPKDVAAKTAPEDSEWYLMTGSATKGWTMSQTPVNGDIKMVLDAYNDQTKNNYYIVEENASGGYETTVSDLPGDVTKYYYMLDAGNKNSAEYNIAFYYTSATSFENATTDNTWMVGNTNSWRRVFSTNVYVANIKNYLLVQQLDPNGDAIVGAKFKLYDAYPYKEDGTENPDAKLVGEEATTRNFVKKNGDKNGDKIDLEGAAYFPNGNSVLKPGTYYLEQSYAPDGYVKNSKITKIIVDDTGVYADAGDAGDGIRVARGIGSVVKSLAEFASSPQVDATLYNIVGKFYTTSSGSFDESNSGTYNWETQGKYQPSYWYADGQYSLANDGTMPNGAQELGMHMEYGTSEAILEYGPASDIIDDLGENALYWMTTDEGWSNMMIEQCQKHSEELLQQGWSYDTLTGEDLTNLFSRTVVVQVTVDVQLCNLTIHKTVAGTLVGADSDTSFDVNVSLTKNGTALTGSFPYYNSSNDTKLGDWTSSTPNLTLTHDQTITIPNIPYGTTFTVTEPAEGNAANYKATYVVEPADGETSEGGDGTTDEGANPDGGEPSNPTTGTATAGTGVLEGDRTVNITNTRIVLGSVEITNTVDGAMGSYSDTFSYTLNLYDVAADETQKPIENKEYQAILRKDGGTEQTVTIHFDSNGQATKMTPVAAEGEQQQDAKDITLAHGDTLTIQNLPAGATFKATEAKNSMGYTVDVTGEKESGTTDVGTYGTVAVPITDTPPAAMTFTNTRAAIIPTGLREENHPYIVMIGLAGMAALVGAAGWVEMRRRKRREEE